MPIVEDAAGRYDSRSQVVPSTGVNGTFSKAIGGASVRVLSRDDRAALIFLWLILNPQLANIDHVCA
jgi:hypothetical protein